ncbi:nucleotidyltransferase domain-containing protein [Haliea salexigens]|uniref:nucleotidyltransferase domain-containing protein n=1 Tax=Haliea salexigens TaxID=287487 RepID=UPI0004153D55|nr:nucleotidyltransferase domain-containing protein [Haliea salexigens]|tara:strand:- start:1947 stop:2570 length:624 start_codon:yes stop_codon:yes gene_type:complete
MDSSQSAIGNALFTKTQQRVLGLLYGRPERSFYLNELVRLADMGKGTIRRELDKLCSVGLVTETRQGNQNHYQANPANPVYSELKGIIDKTFGVVGALAAALEQSLSDITFAFVYGSVAKGEESADSDIDLMLVSDSLGYSDVMSLLLQAEQHLGRKINPTLYSAKEFDQRITGRQNFLTRVLMQSTLWLHGESTFNQQYQAYLNRE